MQKNALPCDHNAFEVTPLPVNRQMLVKTLLGAVIEVFINNTNLTFLYKISIEVKKTKVPPVGLELTTLTISGLQV